MIFNIDDKGILRGTWENGRGQESLVPRTFDAAEPIKNSKEFSLLTEQQKDVAIWYLAATAKYDQGLYQESLEELKKVHLVISRYHDSKSMEIAIKRNIETEQDLEKITT